MEYGVGEALRILVNEAAKIEREAFIGARAYERTKSRRDSAPDFKPKTMFTRLGEITFQAPQVRFGDFYPSALKKGTRPSQAINLALAEMYVQGDSTRRGKDCRHQDVDDLPCDRLGRYLAAPAQGRLDAWRKEHPKLAGWTEEAIPEGLTALDFPAAHRTVAHHP